MAGSDREESSPDESARKAEARRVSEKRTSILLLGASCFGLLAQVDGVVQGRVSAIVLASAWVALDGLAVFLLVRASRKGSRHG